MRVSPIRRSYLGIAAVLSLTLTATFLAYGTAAPPVAAQSVLEPQFLTWHGEPFSDNLNHYVMRVESSITASSSGWLRLDDQDHLVTDVPDPESRVSVQEIDRFVTGADSTRLDAGAIVDQVASHRKVTTVRSVGFGIYAVAGTINSAELATITGVHDVRPDAGVAATSVDPYYPTQWALENDGISVDPWQLKFDADSDAPEGWHRTRGDGVVVAVIDSGTDINHPDLVNSVWQNPGEVCGNAVDDDNNGYTDDCAGWDFANGDSSVDDLVGHGTHVAGIIAAQADNGIGIAGVAYEADVMVLKIGDGTPALSAAIEAIAYAIANGARIINASWVVDDPAAAPYLDTALAAAAAAGVLVVTGAGNEPIDIDANPIYPASSNLDNVIVVGASTATDTAAVWSGYGQQTVDLFAPGEYIISTVPGGYGVYSGTSMAAPMVAGAAALLWAATPAATYAEVKGALLDRSDGPNDGVTTFRNLANSDGRLNIERSIYTRLFQPSLMYEFYEFNSFRPEEAHKVAITAKTVDPWILPPQTPAMYRAGLYVPVDGQPMAVVGHEITYTGAGGDLTVVTDNTGRALVGTEFEWQRRSAFVQEGDFTPLAMELPAGTYAFVMEVVDITNPDAPATMGDPSAVFFIVDEDGAVTEMPQIPVAGDPAPTTSTTADPGTSTTTSQAPPTTALAPTTSTTLATTDTTQPTQTTTPPPVDTTTTTTMAPSTTTSTAPPPTSTTPPTSAPPTTVPQTTTTTTTTSVPAPEPTTTTTTTTAAPSVTDATVISGVNPAQGPIAGNTLVTITGKNLPELPEVSFGGRGAQIVSVIAPTFIVVDTPPGTAGFVDVTVVDRVTGVTTVYADGYQYVADGEAPATTSTLPTPSTTTTAPAVAATTTTIALTTTTILTTTTSTSMVTTTTAVPLPDPSLDDWLDSMLRTPSGLDLAPPAAGAGINQFPVELWAGALCDEPVCPGWVMEQ